MGSGLSSRPSLGWPGDKYETGLEAIGSNLLLEKLPRPEVEDLLLEEVPDISYADIGGLDSQIEQIAASSPTAA